MALDNINTINHCTISALSSGRQHAVVKKIRALELTMAAKRGLFAILIINLFFPAIQGGVVQCKKPKCPSLDHCSGMVVKKRGACCPECQGMGIFFDQ